METNPNDHESKLERWLKCLLINLEMWLRRINDPVLQKAWDQSSPNYQRTNIKIDASGKLCYDDEVFTADIDGMRDVGKQLDNGDYFVSKVLYQVENLRKKALTIVSLSTKEFHPDASGPKFSNSLWVFGLDFQIFKFSNHQIFKFPIRTLAQRPSLPLPHSAPEYSPYVKA